MKNVYHDIEIENDTPESVEEEDARSQFREVDTAPKKRRVEYDEKGRVRRDNSLRWGRIALLVIALVLVNLYAFHTCGADLARWL